MNTDSQAIAIVKRAGHACGGHADFRYFFPIAPRDKYPCKRRDDGSTRRHGIFPSDRDYCRTAFPFDFRQRRWLPSPTTRYKTPIPYLKIYYLNITHIIPTEKLSKLIQACSDRPVPASHSSFKPEEKRRKLFMHANRVSDCRNTYPRDLSCQAGGRLIRLFQLP